MRKIKLRNKKNMSRLKKGNKKIRKTRVRINQIESWNADRTVK